VLICVVVSGLANGVTQPAWFAFVTQLVPREDMLNAVRLNTVQNQGARTFGPGVAGLVLATLGPGAAFFGNGVSFVIVLAGLAGIPHRRAEEGANGIGIWSHFREGVQYVRERRVLAATTLTFFVFTFFAPAIVQLYEPFARRVLHVGAGQYG